MLKKIFGGFNSRALGVLSAFVVKVSGAGLGFLLSLLLARFLGASGTGVYFLSLTIVSIGATLARLGLDNAVLKFASIAIDRGDRGSLSALYKRTLGLLLLSGGGLTCLLLLIVPSLSLGGNQAGALKAILPPMLIALTPMALVLVHGEFLKSSGSPGLGIFTQASSLQLFMVLGIICFSFVYPQFTINQVALLYLVSACLSLMVAFLLWQRRQPGLWKISGEFSVRVLLATSFPLLWVASMNMVMGWTDILVLGIWNDSSVVGIYGVANRIAAPTAFVLTAVNSVTAPRFAALHALGDHKALESLAQKSAFWMLVVVSPIVLLLMFAPGWVMGFFGPGFAGGSNLIRILAAGQLINVSVGSVGYLLMMTGHERLMRNNIMITSLLNLVGNLIFVPKYGAVGAAMTTAFSLGLMNLISFIFVNRKLKINTLGYLFGKKKICAIQ